MDTVVDGVSTDEVLIILIDVIVSSIESGRPLFNNPLDEPLLYKHLVNWVVRGLKERAEASEYMTKAEAPFSKGGAT